MNKKVLALFVIFIIINLTPAYAYNLQDLENDAIYVNNYRNASGWYKFCHSFTYAGVLIRIAWNANDVKNEVEVYKKNSNEINKFAKENTKEFNNNKKKKVKISSYYRNIDNKSDWSKIKNNSVNNTNNTNNTNKTRSIKSLRSEIIQNETNQIDNSQNDNSPPIEVRDDATKVKNQLQSNGIEVEVKNVLITDLETNDIVQLVNQKGYVKYWLYNGIENSTDSKVVKLYTGKNDKIITLNKFKNSYTGLVLENIATNCTEITAMDIVDKIYENKVTYLEDKIVYYENLSWISNILKGTGIALGTAAPIISLVATALLLAPEPIITKATAIILYTIAIILFAVSAAVYGAGLILESISNNSKIGYVAEKDDLVANNI